MISMIFRQLGQERATPPSWKLLLCLAGLTMLVRVSYMIIFESWDFKDDWAFGHEMGRGGQWLALGKGFTQDGSAPTAKFPPVYPLIVGAAFYVFGVYTKAAAVSLFLFQSVCSALIAVCLANLGNRLVGRTTGVVAALIWAFYPTSIFYSAVRVWYSELALLLVLLVTTIAVASSRSPTYRRFALIGALSGLAVLTDSTMIIYLLLLPIWMLLFAQQIQARRLVGLAAVWMIAAGVVTSPWIARNWLVLGSPILLKSNLGAELLYGTATNNRGAVIRSFDQKQLAHHRSQSEVAYNRYLQEKALERILKNPIEFVVASAKRFWQFWIVNTRLGSETFVRLAYFGPCLLLALYALYYYRKRRWQLAPVWLFLFIYPLPFYVMHVDRGRYSYPVEPFVVLLAAAPLAVWCVRYVATKRFTNTFPELDARATNS